VQFNLERNSNELSHMMMQDATGRMAHYDDLVLALKQARFKDV
jgi:hypothetical protein